MDDSNIDTQFPASPLFPLAQLMDDLKHDDPAVRLNAFEHLPQIATSLEPERTRSELIPFLEDSLLDDEDDVYLVIAEKLRLFVPLVGGPDHISVLLPALESLLSLEPPIRDQAIQTFNYLAAYDGVSDSQIIDDFLPLVMRLGNNKWIMTRVSATALFKNMLQKLPVSYTIQLEELFTRLVKDDPMVRRAAATHLPFLVPYFDHVQEMLDLLFNDPQDSVRLLTIDTLVALTEKLDASSHISPELNDQLLNYCLSLFTDKSWRVRYMTVERIDKIVSFLITSPQHKELITSTVITLIKDKEAEVRTVMAKKLPAFCKILTPENILDSILPLLDDLANDENEHVRAAFSSKITDLSPILGKDLTIQYLLPTFLALLRDDFSDVRLNIISNLSVVNKVIGISHLATALLLSITDLASSPQWRVRLEIVKNIPPLSSQLGVEFFNKELKVLSLNWLCDPVYSIRETAMQNLRSLTQIFGVEWCKKEIISSLITTQWYNLPNDPAPSSQTSDEDIELNDADKDKDVSADNNDLKSNVVDKTKMHFQYRLTAIQTLNVLVSTITNDDIIINYILPFLKINFLEDDIPNIRFNVSKIYVTIVKQFIDNFKSTHKDIFESKPTTNTKKEENHSIIAANLNSATPTPSSFLPNSEPSLNADDPDTEMKLDENSPHSLTSLSGNIQTNSSRIHVSPNHEQNKLQHLVLSPFEEDIESKFDKLENQIKDSSDTSKLNPNTRKAIIALIDDLNKQMHDDNDIDVRNMANFGLNEINTHLDV